MHFVFLQSTNWCGCRSNAIEIHFLHYILIYLVVMLLSGNNHFIQYDSIITLHKSIISLCSIIHTSHNSEFFRTHILFIFYVLCLSRISDSLNICSKSLIETKKCCCHHSLLNHTICCLLT